MPHESELRPIVVQAPAKLNLGLEILGRRADGYHDLATIFTTISLHDTLCLSGRPDSTILCECPGVSEGENLAVRALQALRAEAGIALGASVLIQKQIPMASGLGGASSNAAAALVGASKLWNVDLSDIALKELALTIGSDVPFFLHGGAAYGTGLGEILELIELPDSTHFVVVVPRIAIPRKTAGLYASLEPQDFSDGERVAKQVDRLRSGLSIEPNLLGNAFSRPLYQLVPALADLPALMRAAGAPTVALSGAGPAHYSVVADLEQAENIARNVRRQLANTANVFVASLGPIPVP